jgi:predicted 3-demethylubiquinone-9 3-methyltransferase (glyoxalase superfamily)
MTPITPCLWFAGDGERAADFYTSVFPDSRVVGTTAYGPDNPGGMPEGSVMTVEFEINGRPFVALNVGPEFTFSEAISFQIACDSQEEADRYWDVLGEGGELGPCGWLKDKFGLSWQVFPAELTTLIADPDPQRAQRAMQTMLQQSKIDIAAIRAAADG